MSLIDFFPTPAETAERLVEHAKLASPDAIADFSAGNGSLLHAGKQRWPGAEVIATDIHPALTRKLKAANPSWHVGTCNFLHAPSMAACRPLQANRRRVDVVLLNPPFSLRGSRNDLNYSPALRFLINATEFLSERGQICAVMPTGAIYGDRGILAGKFPVDGFRLDVCEVLSRKLFKGCFAEAAIVTVERGIIESSSSEASNVPNVLRGSVQVHNARSSRSVKALPFVHSTNLQEGKVLSDFCSVQTGVVATGPAVLLPRVGRPAKQKVCVLPKGVRVLMSDCVMALPVMTSRQAHALRRSILQNFELVADSYRGTGAPYITKRRLTQLMAKLHGRGGR